MYATSQRLDGVSAPPVAMVSHWARQSRHNDLIDMAQAVPSYPPASTLRAHLSALVSEHASALYTPIRGLPELRAALADHLSEDYATTVETEQVNITAGCNQAFCVAMQAITNPGDSVILTQPFYFNHKMWLDALGVDAVLVPLVSEHDVAAHRDAFAQKIDARTRAIVLVSPNNPTGAIYSARLLDTLHELCAERGIALVVDETYKDFREDTQRAHDLFQNPAWSHTFVQLLSFSKSLSLAGYRVGAVVCGSALGEKMEKVLDCIAICAPNISQRAALFGLTELIAWRSEKRALMTDRMAAFRRAFAAAGLSYRLISAGAYMAYIEHPFVDRTAHDVARALAIEHGLLCMPGSAFGPRQDRYLRFAFANTDTNRMPDLTARLRASETRLPELHA